MGDQWNQGFKLEFLKTVLKEHLRTVTENNENIYIQDEGYANLGVLIVWANHTINHGSRIWRYARGIAVMRGRLTPNMEDVYLASRMVEQGLDRAVLTDLDFENGD